MTKFFVHKGLATILLKNKNDREAYCNTCQKCYDSFSHSFNYTGNFLYNLTLLRGYQHGNRTKQKL
jgi:hypothetical protein